MVGFIQAMTQVRYEGLAARPVSWREDKVDRVIYWDGQCFMGRLAGQTAPFVCEMPTIEQMYLPWDVMTLQEWLEERKAKEQK